MSPTTPAKGKHSPSHSPYSSSGPITASPGWSSRVAARPKHSQWKSRCSGDDLGYTLVVRRLMLASPVPQSASHLSNEVETDISSMEMGAVILLFSEDRCMAESVTEESPSWCAPHGPTQHRLKTPQLRITWSTCWCMGVGETASWPPARSHVFLSPAKL